MLLFIFKNNALRFVLYEWFNDENDTKQTPKKNTNLIHVAYSATNQRVIFKTKLT